MMRVEEHHGDRQSARGKKQIVDTTMVRPLTLLSAVQMCPTPSCVACRLARRPPTFPPCACRPSDHPAERLAQQCWPYFDGTRPRSAAQRQQHPPVASHRQAVVDHDPAPPTGACSNRGRAAVSVEGTAEVEADNVFASRRDRRMALDVLGKDGLPEARWQPFD